jgi:YHS domain-containing protein
MQVETTHAPATAVHDDHRYYFCSDRCAERFAADPGRHIGLQPESEGSDHGLADHGTLHSNN